MARKKKEKVERGKFYASREVTLIEFYCDVLLGKLGEDKMDMIIHKITEGGGVVVEWSDINGMRSYLINRSHGSFKTSNDGKTWDKLCRELRKIYKEKGVKVVYEKKAEK